MTTYRNDFAAPPAEIPQGCHLHTPPEDYDLNYIFPVKTLRSDRVDLRPYVPSQHAQLLLDGVKANPEILQWLGTPEWQDLDEVLVWSEKVCRRPSECLFYAIFTDKPGSHTPKTDPKDYVFAGVMAMIQSTSVHLMIEPGWIIILKPFQRTHVLTHAAGLVMHRILDMPKDGGLGMRRCQWTTTTLNLPSQNAARRLGYTYEGVLRAQWVCPPGKQGARPGRKGDAHEDGMARDNWFASIIWEDWEESVRDHVDKLMARRY